MNGIYISTDCSTRPGWFSVRKTTNLENFTSDPTIRPFWCRNPDRVLEVLQSKYELYLSYFGLDEEFICCDLEELTHLIYMSIVECTNFPVEDRNYSGPDFVGFQEELFEGEDNSWEEKSVLEEKIPPVRREEGENLPKEDPPKKKKSSKKKVPSNRMARESQFIKEFFSGHLGHKEIIQTHEEYGHYFRLSDLRSVYIQWVEDRGDEKMPYNSGSFGNHLRRNGFARVEELGKSPAFYRIKDEFFTRKGEIVVQRKNFDAWMKCSDKEIERAFLQDFIQGKIPNTSDCFEIFSNEEGSQVILWFSEIYKLFTKFYKEQCDKQPGKEFPNLLRDSCFGKYIKNHSGFLQFYGYLDRKSAYVLRAGYEDTRLGSIIAQWLS